MRIKALVVRILRQFIRDKRTLGLLIFAPMLILSMVYLVFNGNDYAPKVGFVNFPEVISSTVDTSDAEITEYNNEDKALNDLQNKNIDSYIYFNGQMPQIVLEGSDPSINSAVLRWVQAAFQPLQQNSQFNMEIEYLHGSGDMSQFDYFGPVLLGFFVFFFVFIIAGVSFLRERTRGTLEKLLSSPLRRWEIVVGYLLGFGIFTMFQATIIVLYAIYVLGMLSEGSFFYVLLIILLLSLTALTLGILLSTFAKNELQMIQFIPIVVVPQIFFSGLFNLETISDWLSWISPITPLYYAASSLRDVMIRGYGWEYIRSDILALTCFSLLFITLNILTLKKYRKI